MKSYDVILAYRAILGRLPGREEFTPDDGHDLLQLIISLLASAEFKHSIVEPAVSGRWSSALQPAPMSVVRWLRQRLGVDLSAYATVGEALSGVLLADPIRPLLANLDLAIGWSPQALSDLLRAPLLLDQGVDQTGSSLTLPRLQSVSRGVTIINTVDLTLNGVRNFSMTSEDPSITFTLDGQAIKDASAAEIRFAVAGARKGAKGVLYVSYQDGISERCRINLFPAGRRQYSALILDPARVQCVRWDPDDHPGEIIIVQMVLEPLSREALGDRLRSAGDEWGHLPADIGTLSDEDLIAASRSLTQALYDHREPQTSDYAIWIENNEPAPSEAQTLWEAELKTLDHLPLISVLVPTYETPALLLREMIESVIGQVYPNWELCIADDASKSPHVRDIIQGYLASDPRIKAVFRPSNGHISEASNSALELATGEWLALLDHDDVLAPNALLSVALEASQHPKAVFIYSDEDKLGADNIRYEPFFKPDFSPELLRSQNYLNHLSVHRTSRVREYGGWRKGFEGSQDYDLNLRTLERTDPKLIRHIPKVLYHWRAVKGSTALAIDQKDYAFEAGQRALKEHVRRMGWKADVEAVLHYPFHRVRYAIPSPPPLVSIIIPTRDRADLLRVCVSSIIDRTDYDPYEILIVDNDSVEPETFALFDELKTEARIRVVLESGPFNYSKINNAAVRVSDGAIVCLLNNDIEIINADWMREMVSWAVQPRIGCVGAKLYYPNDTVQHAGVTLGMGGIAGHPHKHRGRADPGYFGRLVVSHDVSAVTGACLFVRREVYDECGGLDERLQVAFNDVDFCIRVTERGYQNVFTPFAELYHHESVSRGEDGSPEKRARFLSEIDFMERRWPEKIALDPFYSPNLTQVKDDYTIAQ